MNWNLSNLSSGGGATFGSPVGRRAVLLDRDDTILDTTRMTSDLAVPGDLYDPARVRLWPGAGPALARLVRAGYLLIVHSNQGGIARGHGTLADLHAVNDAMRTLLQPFGVTLAGVYACPYHPTGSVAMWASEHAWRKPSGAMLAAACSEVGVDVGQSWCVGDKPRDVQAGVAAGVSASRCVLLGTSGSESGAGVCGGLWASSIVEAAEMIIAAG
jgi:D-glycero-D-manno-heptose 1,7-bisphosphate phosphatase